MKSRLLSTLSGILTLTILMIVFAGCEQESAPLAPGPGLPAPDQAELQGTKGVDGTAIVPNPGPSDDRLAYLWYLSQVTSYDMISGPISVQDGGELIGAPPGWPLSAKFMISVPPGAIPPSADDDGDGLVTLSIGVPRQPFPLTKEWAPVYKLEPDGLVFEQPVQVVLSYPNWMRPTASLVKYCLVRLPDGSFVATDYEAYHSNVGPLGAVWFSTTHFSEWPIEDGKGG